MPYDLFDDLTFCRVDNHVIFMDVQNDRYFRLPADLEHAFLAVAGGQEGYDARTSELLRRNILVEVESIENEVVATSIEAPSRSATEYESDNRKLHILTYIEVLAIIFSTRCRLNRQKLKDLIDWIVADRRENADTYGPGSAEYTEHRLLHAVHLFRHMQRYVPIKTSCLLDSLSMVRFLSRRRLPASIVFGVTLNPFTAHCWVQVGSLILNETVGDANSHTPIRAV